MMRRYLGIAVIAFLAACSDVSLDSRASEAEALLGIGNHEAALKIYQEITERCPAYERCAEILLHVGDIEADMRGNPQGAIVAYSSVIELFPTKEAGRLALERRSRIFEINGDRRGAAGDYAQLLQYFPKSTNYALYLLRLGESYLGMKNYKQARLELRGLVRSEEVDPLIRQEALFAYAESFFLEGRLGLAEKAYRMLVDQYPESKLLPEVRMKIATCQEERGFLGDAKRSLRQVKKEYPNASVIDERLDAMKKRGKEAPPEDVMKFVKRAEKEEAEAAAEVDQEKETKK